MEPESFVDKIETFGNQQGFTPVGIFGFFDLIAKEPTEKYFWLRLEAFVEQNNGETSDTYRQALLTATRNASQADRDQLWQDLHGGKTSEDVQKIHDA